MQGVNQYCGLLLKCMKWIKKMQNEYWESISVSSLWKYYYYKDYYLKRYKIKENRDKTIYKQFIIFKHGVVAKTYTTEQLVKNINELKTK